jgi:hypothetical protein
MLHIVFTFKIKMTNNVLILILNVQTTATVV